jgi:methionyl-tRNA formyltransferase
MDGDDKTGVSIMKMDIGLDTGDVILVEEVEIEPNDNFESVHDKLIVASNKGLLKTIELFENGKATFKVQGDNFTYAEKITKADCLIDFGQDVSAVHNKIRGLSPIPLSYTKLPDGKILKVTRAHIAQKDYSGRNGEVVGLEDGIMVKCQNGTIVLDEIIPEGKGRMNAQAFINGRKIAKGDILG